MILSVDPGDTTGYVVWDDAGHDLYRGQLPSGEFIDRLATGVFQSLTRIIVEDYRLRRNRAAAQTGSKFQAVQVIGALKMLSKQTNARLYLQEAQCKDLGSQFSGQKPPSNHAQSHWVDAYNHGYYWLVKNGIRQTKQQESRRQESAALPTE